MKSHVKWQTQNCSEKLQVYNSITEIIEHNNSSLINTTYCNIIVYVG